MLQRGRKSAESMVVVPTALIQRPDAPAELSPEQVQTWRVTVNQSAAGFCRLSDGRRLLDCHRAGRR
jgi:hypothetical protein